MKNPISKIILPLILLIACALPSIAQTQYEHAVISYNSNEKSVYITINDKEFLEKKITSKEKIHYCDFRHLLREVNGMTEQGWEVYQTTNIGAGTNYFLKRKKQ